jgi:hypothetical protein
MVTFNRGLIVLIVDDYDIPGWYPIELFDIESGDIPSGWKMALRSGVHRV